MKGPVTRKMIEAGVAQLATVPDPVLKATFPGRYYRQACEDAVVRIFRAMEAASEAPGPAKS